MAFVCTLDDEFLHAHFFERKGSSYIGLFPIGYDDAADWSYSALVSLDSMAGGDMEFVSCLIKYDGETDSEHTYWSGQEVARFIRREDRRVILSAIVEATRRLILSARPARVFYCTWDADAPEHAMRKHLLIAHVFEACGYVICTADPWHGRRAWWMERLDSPAVNVSDDASQTD